MKNSFVTKYGFIFIPCFLAVGFIILFNALSASAYYTPGETLNPDCAPTDSVCDIYAPLYRTTTEDYILPTPDEETNWNDTYTTVDKSSPDWDTASAEVLSNSATWNQAYLWGNHASAGYLAAVFGSAAATGTLNVSGNLTVSSSFIFAGATENKWLMRNVTSSTDSFELYNLENSLSVLKITKDGYVGIGATSTEPAYPLEIFATVMVSGTNYGYLNSDGVVASGTATGDVPVSLRTIGRAFIGDEVDVLSDERLKDFVDDISPNVALSAVNSLRPLHFQWKPGAGHSDRVVAGLYAQEVAEVIPEAVTVASTALLTDQHMLNYNALTVYAIASLQALDEKIISIQNNASIQSASLGELSNLALIGTLSVAKHVTYGSDTVGEAKLFAGQMFVTQSFQENYAYKPVITVTPQSEIIGQYWVGDITSSGFTIRLSEPQPEDVIFSWHAFAGSGINFNEETGLVEPAQEDEPIEENAEDGGDEESTDAVDNTEEVEEAAVEETNAETEPEEDVEEESEAAFNDNAAKNAGSSDLSTATTTDA